MPRWRKLCKDGEEPSRDVAGKEFEGTFGIQTYYPARKAERRHCCWSHVPEEWVPAVLELVSKIRAKYKTVGLDNIIDGTEVRVVQIKDKFGKLCFYYAAIDDRVYDDIDKMIAECIEKLKEADPHYGVPY